MNSYFCRRSAFGGGVFLRWNTTPPRIVLSLAIRGTATPYYCLAAGGLDSGGGAGSAGSAAGAAPRSSGAAAQSPAPSLVPLTVPTSLQPIGADGFTCFRGFPPTLGAV